MSSVHIAIRAVTGALVVGGMAFGFAALLAAAKTFRELPGSAFDLAAGARAVALPVAVDGWIQLIGIAVFGAIGGLFTGAWAGRHR